MTVVVRRTSNLDGGRRALSDISLQPRQHSLCAWLTSVTAMESSFCNGSAFQSPMGLTLLCLAPGCAVRQASLIATLETPLMPFWIWLASGDSLIRAVIGGALVWCRGRGYPLPTAGQERRLNSCDIERCR